MSVTITKRNGEIDHVQISYEEVKPFYNLLDYLWNSSDVKFNDQNLKEEMKVFELLMDGRIS